MTTAVIGMPLKATEKAALAMTPAARTFQRWRGRSELDVGMHGSVGRWNHFENQKIIDTSSRNTGWSDGPGDVRSRRDAQLLHRRLARQLRAGRRPAPPVHPPPPRPAGE